MLFVTFPLMLLVFSVYLSFCHFDYSASWYVPLWINPLWDSAFWPWVSLSFPRLGRFSAIISSNIFSGNFSLSSSWSPYNASISVPDVSQTVLISFILFSFFCLTTMISTISLPAQQSVLLNHFAYC